MYQLQKLIECNFCKNSFDVSKVEIYPKIVSKNNLKAVAYCFRCPKCSVEYICYFKDSEVNALFRKGNINEAQKRMKHLWEIFMNDSPI